jgi:hypothetical protein
MAGLAKSIQLFNSAYALAWDHVAKQRDVDRSTAAVALSNSIRLQIKSGMDDPSAIALEAIRNLAR